MARHDQQHPRRSEPHPEQFRDQLGAVSTSTSTRSSSSRTSIYGQLTRGAEAQRSLHPRQFNANRLLAAVDILVSDFSSIFFDFMVTGRPVYFYIPDRHAEYSAERASTSPRTSSRTEHRRRL
ncbi:MAG: CDP-glycerol glycerophosphotransferase family protein [Propionicimonas sp.]